MTSLLADNRKGWFVISSQEAEGNFGQKQEGRGFLWALVTSEKCSPLSLLMEVNVCLFTGPLRVFPSIPLVRDKEFWSRRAEEFKGVVLNHLTYCN